MTEGNDFCYLPLNYGESHTIHVTNRSILNAIGLKGALNPNLLNFIIN